jgi:hypothetical protein
MVITLFIVPGKPESVRAISFIEKSMKPGCYKVKECNDDFANEHVMPFIRLEDIHAIYGIEGVEYFLEHRAQYFPETA